MLRGHEKEKTEKSQFIIFIEHVGRGEVLRWTEKKINKNS